jgi:transcriptional regulator with XRE-family HTH domain
MQYTAPYDPEMQDLADMTVGRQIRQLRQARDLTQQQLATHAHISLRTLANVENDEDTLLSTLQALADALGVSVSELFGKAS